MTPQTLSRRFLAPAILSAVVALGACAPKAPPQPEPERLTLTRVGYDALPGWSADGQGEALPALRRSCRSFDRQPDDRSVGPDRIGGTMADWRAPCAALAGLDENDDAAARAYFETWFVPYLAGNNGASSGLFTGYYEAELRGARGRRSQSDVPLYRRPDDLVMVDLGEFRSDFRGERIAGRVRDGRLRPYEDRAAIADGALAGKNLELLWVDDAIDAFFLEIQGSGRVVLNDGEVIRVGYDGQNGHPYTAIGRELIARGELDRETVSLQSIKAWLRANPDQAATIMNTNPSYVFFRILDGEGPVGAQGVALTPGRSLAIDRRFMPLGAPVWLDAQHPTVSDRRLRQLLIAQDTGGAIRGPVRGDVFWGHGPEAELMAGMMKSAGTYYLLLPKSVSIR